MSYFLHTVLIVAPLSIVVIAVLTFFHQRKLGKHRGLSKADFVNAFENASVSPKVSGAVYDYYKSQVISSAFSVAPDDNYEDDLYSGEEDIEDDLDAIAKVLGLKTYGSSASLRPDYRIQNLRDMVQWLDSLAKAQAR
jgi:hypothetical protein